MSEGLITSGSSDSATSLRAPLSSSFHHGPEGARPPHPYYTANVVSRVLLLWATALVRKGYHTLLMPQDLWPITDEVRAEDLYDGFTARWNELAGNATLLKCLHAARPAFLLSFWLQLLYVVCQFVVTIALLWLIDSLTDPTIFYCFPWIYASILLVGSLVGGIARNHSMYQMSVTSMIVRNVMMTAVYMKATRLSSRSMADNDSGKIINMMTSDASRMNQVGRWMMAGFVGPLELIGCFIFMGFVVGWYSLVAFGLLVISLPVNALVAKWYFSARTALNPLTDARMKHITEFVKYIRAVKYYAWERFFAQRINERRVEEMDECYDLNVSRMLLLQVSQMTGSITLAAVLCSYVGGGNVLTASTAFVIFRIVNMLRTPYIMVPVAVSSLGSLKSSFDRVTEFLRLPELDTSAVDRTVDVGVVSVENGNFSWGIEPALHDINVQFPRGKLTVVIGQVGSGKSSLLHALLGDMERDATSVARLGGRVAYVAQTAFILNETIRENVCYGIPYDEVRYQRAVYASDLGSDFKLLPGGDLTEIGERGLNLSGGQKQRVSLARALYADADVVLLDDPLSAVDAHVGEHIFEKAIKGSFAGKTVILVSNQLHFLPSADYVVAMEHGRVRERGTYQELMSNGSDFAALVESFGVHRSAEDESAKRKAELDVAKVIHGDESILRQKASVEIKLEEMRQLVDKDRLLAGRLVMAEAMQGSSYVDLSVYTSFFAAGSWALFAIAMVILAISCIAAFFPGLWIGYWSAQLFGNNLGLYVGVLWMFVIVELLAFFYGSLLMVKHGQRASLKLHGDLLDVCTHATVAFFDTTPVGRILNRFSKDMDNLDTTISFNLQQFVRNALQLLALVGFIAYGSPWLLLAIGPTFVMLWFYLLYFRRTTVRLQRIEAITLSPIFQHFSETLPGLSTVRAYGMTAAEAMRSMTYINGETLVEFAIRSVDAWIGIRLDILCFVCLVVVCYVMVGLRDTLNSYVAGFTINYMLATVQFLGYLSLNMTQMETQMNAVERIIEYSDGVPQEAPFDIPENDPPPEWPQEGRIDFENVQFRYREGLPLVLNGVSLSILPSHKVGIVGRTGAGKSSLLVIMLRMAELSGGTIRIDGVDISTIGLHALRSKVAIIPQEPTLFACSIRENLDPFFEHTDDEIWHVLKLSGMAATVEADGGLGTMVVEDGLNYSLGQRQLLCMGRALLRKPKILLMDEATASVDMENDMLLQETVRSAFLNSTVLTIAHRLHSVVDSDEVLVLDKGNLAEMDRPDQLIQRESSLFKSLIDATGSASSMHLTNYILHGKSAGRSITNLMREGMSSTSAASVAVAPKASAAVLSAMLDVKPALARVQSVPGLAPVVLAPSTWVPHAGVGFVYADDSADDSFEAFVSEKKHASQ